MKDDFTSLNPKFKDELGVVNRLIGFWNYIMLSKHEELHKNLTCLNIIKNYDKKISDQQIGTAMNLSSTYFQLFSILSNMYTFRSVPLLRFDTKPEKESLKESLTFWEKGSPCKACITLYMYLFESIYKQKCENNYFWF